MARQSAPTSRNPAAVFASRGSLMAQRFRPLRPGRRKTSSYKNEPDAAVELAALEFLAAVVDAGEAFLVKKRARGDCVVC